MILEIKQYLNGENNNIPTILKQLTLEEGFLQWKNVIFKLRKLSEKQIHTLYELFNEIYIANQPEISDNEKLTQYLQLCRLCENFTSGKYINWTTIYEKLIQQNQQFIFDKLAILGEYELLSKCDVNQIQNLSTAYLKKFLKLILCNKTEEWEKYKTILLENTDLLLKVMLSPKIKQNTESILYTIAKNTNQQKEIFDSLVKNWSNKNFIKNASFKSQLFVSNLIVSFIQDGFNNDLIHDGIQKRLNNQAQVPRKCGMLVWQAFVQSLKLETDIPFDEFLNDEIEEIWKEEKAEQTVKLDDKQVNEKKSQLIEANDEFYDFEVDNNANETVVVKNLYDCILALRSEDQNRIDQALKHLPYLIRNGLDLHVHGQTLSDILMLSQDWKNHQEESRINSLVALSIMRPQITDHLLELYFGESIALFQRIFILKVIRESAIELSSNPNKYKLENFDQYEKSENSTFYFKQISTTYKSDENIVIKQRPEPKSRRWGHTKRAFEGFQIVQPYVNQFHQLTEHFYFPLLVYSETKHRLLLAREPMLMLNFLEVILKMLDCGQNAMHINRMVSVAIEFLEKFDKNKNIEIILMKLRIVLKITILQKEYYDERILKILQTLKHDDPRVKQMFEIIVKNL